MKNYLKPVFNVEHFTANEYIANACTSGSYYKFECNAGNKWRSGDLTSADGKTNYTDNWFHKELGYSRYSSYHPCGATHNASTESQFIKGRYYDNGGSDRLIGNYTEVYIWFEPLGKGMYDIHATENLDIKNWEIAKS